MTKQEALDLIEKAQMSGQPQLFYLVFDNVIYKRWITPATLVMGDRILDYVDPYNVTTWSALKFLNTNGFSNYWEAYAFTKTGKSFKDIKEG